jgi:hypothetical protein
MAAYKYPRVVEIVDDLPKTASGKIMRRLLKTAAEVPSLSRRSCWPGLPSGALGTAATAGPRQSTTGRSGPWSRTSPSPNGDSSRSAVIDRTT